MPAGLSANFRYPASYTSTDLRIPSSKRRRDPERGGGGGGGGDHGQLGDAGASATTARPHGAPARAPHGASERNAKALTPKQIRHQLAGLGPALHVPLSAGPDRRAPSMRQRNVATLAAIMHRCMLEGDWVRAGRAWGLLLHTKFGGRHLDIRRDGLYGVGAEVLLRGGGGGQRSELAPCAFAGQGFDAARSYYDLLAVQYAHRRPRSKEVDALDFYSITFALWVSALQDLQDRERDGSDAEDDATSSDGSDSGRSASSEDPWLRKQKCLEKVISGAEQLQQRMDEVMKPPLTQDHASLIELRNQVRQWAKDLKCHRHKNKR